MSLKIKINDKSYSAKEWKDKETEGKKSHRLYVMGPDGEIGHFDLKNGVFNNSQKTIESFGIIDEQGIIEITNNKGTTINLGVSAESTLGQDSDAVNRLHEATERFGKLDVTTSKVEINVGPTVELKIHGRSHWAKANLTIAVEESNDLEELYSIVSDMANAMLDIEIQKLSKR
tara:strand:+ start:1400 stop:1921 length:522 start_codon:yes stop_codon:yes gene_type:complete